MWKQLFLFPQYMLHSEFLCLWLNRWCSPPPPYLCWHLISGHLRLTPGLLQVDSWLASVYVNICLCPQCSGHHRPPSTSSVVVVWFNLTGEKKMKKDVLAPSLLLFKPTFATVVGREAAVKPVHFTQVGCRVCFSLKRQELWLTGDTGNPSGLGVYACMGWIPASVWACACEGGCMLEWE